MSSGKCFCIVHKGIGSHTLKPGLHPKANRMRTWTQHAKMMRTFMSVNLYIVRHSLRQRIDPVPRLFVNLSLPNVKKKMTSTSKRILCEFLLKYRHLADSIRLFAECSSHSWMLFASPQEYIYIERSHRFRMPHSRSDVNAALGWFHTSRFSMTARLESESAAPWTWIRATMERQRFPTVYPRSQKLWWFKQIRK